MYKKFSVFLLFFILTIATLTIKGKNGLSTPIQSETEISESRSFIVDTENSIIYWTGRKTFGKHIGTILIEEGIINTNDRQIIVGEFNIDMKSIKNNDIEDPEMKKKLMVQLQSKDFFNVSDFPFAIFRLTSAVKKEAKHMYLISGDLEIKGIVRKINFPAEIAIAANQLVTKAKFKIDRTLWNIQFGSGNSFTTLGIP